ncbi:MAG: ECF transporter S component [Eubacteriaceae bacterium]|nr:ECF transporter S component [Eubacteriaceae bacterium]
MKNTSKMVTLSMMAALAYIFMFVSKMLNLVFIPSLSFLSYDPKDIVITIAGFIYGPMSALAVSVVVAAVELVTVSTTGIIGFLMNVLSTGGFTCTAAYIYKANRTKKGANISLACAVLMLTVLMCLWNIIVTPAFMKVPRSIVISMLLPGFIPFNILKGTLNAAFILILYKPVVGAIRKAGLLEASASDASQESNSSVLQSSLVLGLVLAVIVILILMLIN